MAKITKIQTSQKQFLNETLRGTGVAMSKAQAAKLGIKNLSARMSELRKEGLVVKVKAGTYTVAARDVNGSRARKVFA